MGISLNICGDINIKTEWKIYRKPERYKHKNGVEDLQKARWYLDRLISNTENDYKPVGEKEK